MITVTDLQLAKSDIRSKLDLVEAECKRIEKRKSWDKLHDSIRRKVDNQRRCADKEISNGTD